MNATMYICILAGISLVFWLMYPADSTYGSSAIMSLMKGDLTLSSIINLVASSEFFSLSNPILIGSLAVALLFTMFGASSIFPIMFKLAVFFVIPNLFLLPTHLLFTGDALGLPLEIRVPIIFVMNVMLLLAAIEYW